MYQRMQKPTAKPKAAPARDEAARATPSAPARDEAARATPTNDEAARAAPVPAHGAVPGFTLDQIPVHPPAAAAVAPRLPNRTGLPDRLKDGIKAMSGVSLDTVKVHYESPEPARLDALAFARGREIHLSPGEEHHLPHEAWHLVQQAQGRVRPTVPMKGGLAINEDAGLEREADAMGNIALRAPAKAAAPLTPAQAMQSAPPASGPGLAAQLHRGKGSKTQARAAQRESKKAKAAAAVGAQARVATFGTNWEKRDWREHTKELDLTGFKFTEETDSGKVKFSNPKGHEIVVDKNAGYWRHLDEAGNYLDKEGKPNTANQHTHFHSK